MVYLLCKWFPRIVLRPAGMYFTGNRSLPAMGMLLFALQAQGFRNCEPADGDAWSASTAYLVGEITFDETTGLASGTETRYNYGNTYGAGTGECHVTYELNGNYVAGVEVFTFSATRTNFSDSCPQRLLASDFPEHRLYALQIELAPDGVAVVHRADNQDYLAAGTWLPGRAMYKTPEQCTIF